MLFIVQFYNFSFLYVEDHKEYLFIKRTQLSNVKHIFARKFNQKFDLFLKNIT